MRQISRMKWQYESAGIEMYRTRESKEWHAAAKTKAHAPSAQAAASLLCYSAPRSFSSPVLRQPDSSAKRTSITAACQRKNARSAFRSLGFSSLGRDRPDDYRKSREKKKRGNRKVGQRDGFVGHRTGGQANDAEQLRERSRQDKYRRPAK